jgi:hypothetical protein
VKETLSTVLVEVDGVPVALESAPDIVFVPENAVKLPFVSKPKLLNLVCM